MPTEAEENLLYAASKGVLRDLTRLVKQGVNVNATLEDGMSALMRAAGHGELDCLEHLIAKGANLEAKGGSGDLRCGLWTETVAAQGRRQGA